MSFWISCNPGRLAAIIISMIVLLLSTTVTVRAQETATDLPMWFDVSSETPPNIRINSDATGQFQNEECVAIDPTNPDNLVAVWRDTRTGALQVGWGYSHDGGNTWTDGGPLFPVPPGYDIASDPVICAGNNGWFHFAHMSIRFTPRIQGLFARISLDSGDSWPIFNPAVEYIDPWPDSPVDDKEWIACDQTGGPTDGNLYLTWSRYDGVNTFEDSVSIWCLRSLDDGLNFVDQRQVSDSDDGVRTWAVPAVGADGRVLIAWTSDYDNAIMYDISYDQADTWGTDRVLQPTSFWERQFDGINTLSFPALASDMSQSIYRGRFYCVYADEAADGSLDLYVTRSLDSGETWTPPVRLNDDPLGSNIDQFHPWTTVNPDGVVTVVFYDRRLDPANYLFDLCVTHSFDGGVTWTPNQRVTGVSSTPDVTNPQQRVLAEYIGVASSRLRATAVYTDTRGGDEDVYAANMPLRLFPPQLIAPDDGSQTTDPIVSFAWDDYSIYDESLVYTLEYTTDPSFATGVVRTGGLTGYTANSPSLPIDQYYWRMRATDPLGDSSAFSTVRSFEVIPACGCECHTAPDAMCTPDVDVLDVVQAVNVAFRNAPDIVDPNPACPYMTTDANCSGATDVLDVVRFVNVAFRNADPGGEFCDPCQP
jgi:hypothetical protein